METCTWIPQVWEPQVWEPQVWEPQAWKIIVQNDDDVANENEIETKFKNGKQINLKICNIKQIIYEI